MKEMRWKTDSTEPSHFAIWEVAAAEAEEGEQARCGCSCIMGSGS